MNSIEDVKNQVSFIVSKIIEKRKERGFSLENMSTDLDISVSAYNKIEKLETKLTIDRFLQICQVLESEPSLYFENSNEKKFNQFLSDNSTGFQGIENYYNDSKNVYESFITSLKNEIEFLRSQNSKLIEK